MYGPVGLLHERNITGVTRHQTHSKLLQVPSQSFDISSLLLGSNEKGAQWISKRHKTRSYYAKRAPEELIADGNGIHHIVSSCLSL